MDPGRPAIRPSEAAHIQRSQRIFFFRPEKGGTEEKPKEKISLRSGATHLVKLSVKKCSYCGRENTDEAVYCQECGTEFATAPTSPNKSPSAGFGIRLLARFVDTLAGLFLGFAAGIIGVIIIKILYALSIIHPGWEFRMRHFNLVNYECSLVGNVVYHYLSEGIYGSTLGKLCCNLRVISEGGKPVTMRGAFIRTVAFYLDALFCGLIGYTSMSVSPLNQRYGDRWGKTVVVKIAELPPESQNARPPHLILGLLAGLACWFGMAIFGLVLKAF